MSEENEEQKPAEEATPATPEGEAAPAETPRDPVTGEAKPEGEAPAAPAGEQEPV